MLTDKTCKTLKPQEKLYRLLDQNGLYIVIHPSGAKTWQFRYQLNGKQMTYSIGSYPDVSLLQARNIHAELRTKVKSGSNPNDVSISVQK